MLDTVLALKNRYFSTRYRALISWIYFQPRTKMTKYAVRKWIKKLHFPCQMQHNKHAHSISWDKVKSKDIVNLGILSYYHFQIPMASLKVVTKCCCIPIKILLINFFCKNFSKQRYCTASCILKHKNTDGEFFSYSAIKTKSKLFRKKQKPM